MQQIGKVCVEPIWETEPETDKGVLGDSRDKRKVKGTLTLWCSLLLELSQGLGSRICWAPPRWKSFRPDLRRWHRSQPSLAAVSLKVVRLTAALHPRPTVCCCQPCTVQPGKTTKDTNIQIHKYSNRKIHKYCRSPSTTSGLLFPPLDSTKLCTLRYFKGGRRLKRKTQEQSQNT